MSDLKNNPHYQNGQFWGRQMARLIHSTVYKDLETAISVKKELVEDLKKEFGWDEQTKDVAENLGIISALEEALAESQEGEKTIDDVVQKINDQFGYVPAEFDDANLLKVILQDSVLIKKANPEQSWSEIVTVLINEAWTNRQDS